MIGSQGADIDALRKDSERVAADMDSKMSESFLVLADSFELRSDVGKLLVNAVKSALKAVGADITGDVTSANDPEVIRGLSAISDMIEDAVDAGVIDEWVAFDVSEITGGDTAANMIVGKINAAMKDKAFLKYVKQPTGKSEVQESERDKRNAQLDATAAKSQGSYEMSEDEMSNLFKSRV